MRELIYTFLLVFLISLNLLSQNVLQKIEVDNLGNVYIIQTDKIIKFDAKGEQKYSFSYKNSGEISSVDVTDPFRILVFYKNFGQLFFLDNTLNITNGPVSLYKKEVVNPVLACNASDKGLWIYDQQGFSLQKFDAGLQAVTRINDLPTLLESAFEPEYMISINSFLYITDPEQGLFIFDQYGSLYKKLHIKNVKIFDVFDNALFYEDSGFIKKISLLDYSEMTMTLKEYKYSGVTVKDKYVYLLNNDAVSYSKVEMKLGQ